MRRVLLLVFVVCVSLLAAGCPSSEEPAAEREAVAPAAIEGNGTPATTSHGGFKEGVDSGRAEDGSDEDK